jgi:hypothetical protein
MHNEVMSTAIWAVIGALGGSFITGFFALRSARLTAERAAGTEQAQRRLDAYAVLLVAAGEVLRAYRRDFYSVASDFGQVEADKLNAQMAEFGSALHRASAVVALTGSEAGRSQGKTLYGAARKVADSRVVATKDDMCPWVRTQADDAALDTAIDEYKAALVPETAASSVTSPLRNPAARLLAGSNSSDHRDASTASAVHQIT